ncbi:hypothetical protein L7F22_023929 [Adiantum nelumboides]|nr:hypothetical protein [Adiantum nelumboides]
MGETVSEPPGAGTSAVAAGILTAAAVVVVAVSWIVSDALSRRWGRLPPGPVGLPVIGNFLELMGSKGLPHRAMARLSRKYGPILFLKLGQAPLVLVSDQRLAKACLTGSNDKIFAGRPQMESIRRLAFGECPGIAMTPYGDAWRHVRKLCSLQLFTTRRVSEFEPLRRSEVMALVRRIKEQAGKKQEAVNLTQALNSLAEAVTSGLLLGKPLAEIGGGEAGVNMLTLVQRMTDLFQAPIIGEFIPALGFLDRGTRAALDQVHVGFEKLFSQLIPERQRRCPDSPQVILDVLLDNLDEDWAKSILMELIAAASDTTAATLDWAMAELVASPQAMKRLQEELDEVVAGEAATDRLIEEAELGKLVYLKAVLKETMRLHPPVPLLVPHMSMETCCYVDGYKIPRGADCWSMLGPSDETLLVGRIGRSTSSPSDFSHGGRSHRLSPASTLSSCHLAAAGAFAQACPWPFPSLSPPLPTLCTPSTGMCLPTALLTCPSAFPPLLAAPPLSLLSPSFVTPQISPFYIYIRL